MIVELGQLSSVDVTTLLRALDHVYFPGCLLFLMKLVVIISAMRAAILATKILSRPPTRSRKLLSVGSDKKTFDKG